MAGAEPSAHELVDHLVRSLVERPDQVEVSEETGAEGDATLLVRVAEGDAGRVIGRQGRVVNAIRTVARAAGAREGRRVVVEIDE